MSVELIHGYYLRCLLKREFRKVEMRKVKEKGGRQDQRGRETVDDQSQAAHDINSRRCTTGHSCVCVPTGKKTWF